MAEKLVLDVETQKDFAEVKDRRILGLTWGFDQKSAWERELHTALHGRERYVVQEAA